MPQPAPPIVVVPKKRGWGCIGCGCGVLLAVVLLLGLTGALAYALYHAAEQYTATAPVAVAAHDAGPAVYNEAQQKLATFEQAFAQQQPATLELNSDEINTLLAHDPAYAGANGHVAVVLRGDTATVQTSVLMGSFEKTVLPNHYLNGDATLGLSVDPATHLLNADLQSMTLNGQTLPPSSSVWFNQVFNQTINQKLQENQLARDFMARVQKAGIENGELVIKLK